MYLLLLPIIQCKNMGKCILTIGGRRNQQYERNAIVSASLCSLQHSYTYTHLRMIKSLSEKSTMYVDFTTLVYALHHLWMTHRN